MSEEADSSIQLLVSNVVNEKHYSHCRLCLKYIEYEMQFVKFDDLITLNNSVGEFKPLSSVISDLFGNEQVFEEIPGIDAVCAGCIDKAIEALKFLESCRASNNKLEKVLNNLAETLNVDIDLTCVNQSLYIVVEEEKSRVVVVKNNDKEVQEKTNIKRGQNKFECLDCDKDFVNVVELKVHNLASHGHLTCEVCHETFLNNVELVSHLDDAHRYECPHCDLRNDTVDQLNKHIDHFHTKYVCKECGITCDGVEKLHSHEHIKHNSCKKNQCSKCGKVYSTKEFYHRHIKLCFEDRLDPHPIRNDIVKTFFCDICGKGYSSYGGLRVHNRFAHGNAKPHVCGQCGKKFTAPSYLKTHMIKHTGEKNFRCEICGNRFVSKEALLYHTRRHTGEKPYFCKFCSERFVNASARAEHIKFKHVGPTLMCEICSQKFVTTHFLKQHMNRHHDPTSRLYVSRYPPDMPGAENYKIK